MSIMVLKALADSLSVGEIKFPAALFTTTLGIPNSSTQESTAFLKLKRKCEPQCRKMRKSRSVEMTEIQFHVC